MRIVLADDDPAYLEMIGELLVADGHEVSTGENGREVIELIMSEEPDLIILDIHMPQGYGTEVMGRIREQTRLKNIPVILVTGFDPEKAQDLLKGVGHLKILSKLDGFEAVRRAVNEAEVGHWTVLLCDDDPKLLDIMTEIFKNAGHAVLAVSGGRDGAEVAREKRPDIAILDIVMVEGYGTAALKGFREDPKLRGLPVIVLTGLPVEQARKLVQEDERTKLMFKPVSASLLLSTARELIDKPTGESSDFKVK